MNFIKTLGEVLTNSRFKSFYWRSAMMFVAGFITLFADHISLFEFSPMVTTVLGLVLGEVSKAVNNQLSGK